MITSFPFDRSSLNRKAILYIAMSLDGYIARKDDGLDWLSDVERTGEDDGYGEFIKNVDTMIIGRRTYETIITRNERPAEENLIFYNKDLNELIPSL